MTGRVEFPGADHARLDAAPELLHGVLARLGLETGKEQQPVWIALQALQAIVVKGDAGLVLHVHKALQPEPADPVAIGRDDHLVDGQVAVAWAGGEMGGEWLFVQVGAGVLDQLRELIVRMDVRTI